MLTHNSYGKSKVRLTKVTRHTDRHELMELDVAVALEGDFAASYTIGDNTKIVATDSMKNTIYVLARNHSLECPEEFAGFLAEHFVERYPQVKQATVSIATQSWQRIEMPTGPHPHAFVSGGNEKRICVAKVERGAPVVMRGGIEDLSVLKTTDSTFKEFVSDEFRTLPDTDDRIFATSINAEWKFGQTPKDWNTAFAAARGAILQTFATHYSQAVQQTLLEMGDALLAACPAISSISISLPNQHRIPFNLKPFGLDNPNIIFVPTDEPFGLITGTIERDPPQ